MNKEDYIEKMMIQHSDELNNQEPPEGHFERFGARLREEDKLRLLNWQTVWKVAASIVFLFLAVNQGRMWLTPAEPQPVTLASVSPEYAEAEYFYTRSIQTGIDSWNSLAASGIVSDEENIIMQEEFKEFERRFEEIQRELEANPYDDRVIQAMLEHYQAKLNVINMIVNKLMEIKQQKMISHETEV